MADQISRSQDILPELVSPEWNTADVPGSLRAIREYVEIEAEKAISWYFKNKASKAILSRSLRVIAIALSTIAGVLPVALNLWKIKNLSIDPGLSVSLLLGVAAGLVGLDHFFGFSSGWIRYVLTATAMQAALEEFRMDWELLNVHLSTPPSNDQVLALLERAKAFRTSIAGMVLEETKSWAAEFQTNLSQLEKNLKADFDQQRAKVEQNLKAQRAALQVGSIEVKVSNALTLDERSFSIWLEGDNEISKPEVSIGSNVWSRTNVLPGMYKVMVKGKRSGADVSTSGVIRVVSGDVAHLAIEMPT